MSHPQQAVSTSPPTPRHHLTVSLNPARSTRFIAIEAQSGSTSILYTLPPNSLTASSKTIAEIPDILAQLNKGPRLLRADQIDDDAGFVRTDVDEEVRVGGKGDDGLGEYGGRVAEVGEGRAGVKGGRRCG